MLSMTQMWPWWIRVRTWEDDGILLLRIETTLLTHKLGIYNLNFSLINFNTNILI